MRRRVFSDHRTINDRSGDRSIRWVAVVGFLLLGGYWRRSGFFWNYVFNQTPLNGVSLVASGKWGGAAGGYDGWDSIGQLFLFYGVGPLIAPLGRIPTTLWCVIAINLCLPVNGAGRLVMKGTWLKMLSGIFAHLRDRVLDEIGRRCCCGSCG